jgi:hypothetical protein
LLAFDPVSGVGVGTAQGLAEGGGGGVEVVRSDVVDDAGFAQLGE